ncbi:MAG: isopeptide-forming domain-containing fimbrial protein [Clostridia bacterium]|nr:isopeptide-forming domain-containing fimbrial protein [Clostridia bacterium]
MHRTGNLCRKGHLCFESIDSVKVNDRDVATRDYQCTAAVNQKGATWTLTISDIKKSDNNLADGATVTVTYNAYLNEDAVIGNVDENTV